MKILHVIDQLAIGGAQTFLAEVCTHWPDKNDQLDVLSLSNRMDLQERFQDLPHVQLLPCGKGKYDLCTIFRLWKLMRSGDYDIIHAHLAKSIAVTLFARKMQSTRLIVHHHTAPEYVQGLFRVLLRLYGAKADRVIATSKIMAQQITQAFYNNSNIDVIYNGIDLGKFECPAGRAIAREQYSIPENAIVIGSMGRLKKIKGMACLIKAMASVVDKHPNAKLVLVGDGPERSFLDQLAHKHLGRENVSFLGYQQNTPAILSCFDIGVMPSISETFGIAAVEMMAMGVPVVVSDAGGLPEVVNYGQAGIIVSVDDDAALAEAILKLLSDSKLRATQGEKAQQFVRENFSIKTTVTKLHALYTRLTTVQRVHA